MAGTRAPRRSGRTAEVSRLQALLEGTLVLSSTLELEAVLRRIVRIACRVVQARYGALGVLNQEGTGLERFVFHGISAAQARRIGSLPEGKGILGVLVREAKPLRLEDISADPRSVGFPPGHPPMRTFLGVPIVSRDRVFGNLYLTEKRGGAAFTEEDEEVAVALARHAGVAVENARLFQDASRRVRELTALQEVGTALLAELDPSRVLRLVASRARDLTRAHAATVAMREGDRMRVAVAVGRGAREVLGRELPIEGSLSGLALTTGRAQRVDDLEGDSRVFYPIASALGARSAMFAPLFEGNRAVGTLGVVHQAPGRFDDGDLGLLRSYANLASLALQNARLFAAERERARAEAELAAARAREQVKADLLRHVIRAQEEERRRVARDLHDSAAQALAGVLLGLKIASQERTLPEVRARLADLRDLVSEAVAETRRLALELRPTILDDLGLQAALQRYVSDFAARTGIEATFRSDRAWERAEPELETVLYRVVQEALTNVAKHAKASSVRIDLARRGGVIRLQVCDDGVGFIPEEVAGGGLGLAGMRERVELVGGRIRIESAPGAGTTVTAEVPV